MAVMDQPWPEHASGYYQIRREGKEEGEAVLSLRFFFSSFPFGFVFLTAWIDNLLLPNAC